jgi:hypothetical protein
LAKSIAQARAGEAKQRELLAPSSAEESKNAHAEVHG